MLRRERRARGQVKSGSFQWDRAERHFLYDSWSRMCFFLVCLFLYSREFSGVAKVFKQMCKPQSHGRCRIRDPRGFRVEAQGSQCPFPLERHPYIFFSFFSVCKGQHSRIGLFPTERWSPGGKAVPEDEERKGGQVHGVRRRPDFGL